MKPGGADPDAVLGIITDQLLPTLNISTAHDVVRALEASGYRIVRAGMVPRLEDLEHTVEVLTAADSIGLDAGTVNIADSRDTVRSLTELAVAVLGLDPDDRDDPQAAE